MCESCSDSSATVDGKSDWSRGPRSGLGIVLSIGLVVTLMITAGSARASSTGGPTVCTCACYNTCGGCGAMSISAGYQLQASYRQAWVNWSWVATGYKSVSPSFSWSGGNYPEISWSGTSASINLNDLAAGTSYTAVTYVSGTCISNGQGAQYQQSLIIQTGGAPTNALVGWVYHILSTPNPYEILQTGSPVSGVQINVTATCQFYGNYGQLESPTKILFSEEGSWPNPPVTTNAQGAYSMTFPMYAEGAAGNLGDIQLFYYYGGNGTCNTYLDNTGSTPKQYTNANVYLTAGGFAGEWTDLAYVPSSMTAQSDYRSFVLSPNPLGYTAAALSLVHTSAAQCGTSFTTTSTQTVNILEGGSGHSQEYQATQTYGGAYPGWGDDSGVSLGWQVGGIMNDSSVTPNSAWPQSFESVAAVPYTTTDWIGDTGFNLGNPAQPYIALEIPTTYGQGNPYPLTVSQTVTFSSTTGTDLTVDVGVDFGVISVGVSVPLTDTTTVVYSTQPTLSCEFYDPSTSQTAVFYYTFNGGSLTEADVIHIWLAGYCPVGEQKC
jgi:hypothetical protein